MSDSAAAIAEELEVLESIYPDELEKISDDSLRIRVEPEEPVSGQHLICSLLVEYTPTYPDELPHLTLEDDIEGELSPSERSSLLDGLREQGEQSLGMAMVFTLVGWLREELTKVLEERNRKEQEEADRKYREAEEAEAARKRGTPVTKESFKALMARLREQANKAKQKAEEDRIRAMTPKEREEHRKVQARPTGRQLFETSKVAIDSDAQYVEEGVEEVDWSKYSREERDKARQEAEREQEEKQQAQKPAVDVYDSD